MIFVVSWLSTKVHPWDFMACMVWRGCRVQTINSVNSKLLRCLLSYKSFEWLKSKDLTVLVFPQEVTNEWNLEACHVCIHAWYRMLTESAKFWWTGDPWKWISKDAGFMISSKFAYVRTLIVPQSYTHMYTCIVYGLKILVGSDNCF